MNIYTYHFIIMQRIKWKVLSKAQYFPLLAFSEIRTLCEFCALHRTFPERKCQIF